MHTIDLELINEVGKKMYQSVCNELIVRTDFGHSTNSDHPIISMTECKAKREGRRCYNSGNCIAAYDNGKKITRNVDL